MHVSTDYVFGGDAISPYDEAADTGPRSAYGRTKLAGELAVADALPSAFVVRTAWVYGASGNNFVKTMARLERERETVSVVDDQRGSPTWSFDLARGLVALGESSAAGGVFHCTNSGETTWFDAPPDILRHTIVKGPITIENARWLAAGLPALQPWRDALHEAFAAAGDSFRNNG